jgi:surfeit locus 1 family protein
MSTRSPRLFLLLTVVVAGICIRLGIWQLDRLQQRRAANEEISRIRSLPDVSLAASHDSLAHRRVVARGTFDRQHEFVLRGRVHRQAPGVLLVTPLRLAGRDTAVLVNRGFVAAPDAATPDLSGLDEPGTIEVRGLSQPIARDPDGAGRNESRGMVSWARLDLASARAAVPYPLLDIVILQTPDSALPRRPRRQEAAALDDGPHLSYAIQWFAFATIALAGGGIIYFRGSLFGRRGPL